MPHTYSNEFVFYCFCRPTDNGDGRAIGTPNRAELTGYTLTLLSGSTSIDLLASGSATSISIDVQWSADRRQARVIIPGQTDFVVCMHTYIFMHRYIPIFWYAWHT